MSAPNNTTGSDATNSVKKEDSSTSSNAKADSSKLDLPDAGKALKTKAVYFYDPEVSIYEHAIDNDFKPFRAKLAHVLIHSYGLFPQFLEPIHPRLATRTDMGQYHSDNYLEVLSTAQAKANHDSSWPSKENNSSQVDEKVEEVMAKFNLFLDRKKYRNAVFPGVFDYSRLVVSGSMGCAARLRAGDVNMAFNWFGGMSCARNCRAQNGSYINDVVLAILELLQSFQKVLYINLTGVHGTVEEAFYTTRRVLTMSYHLKDKDMGGDIMDIGVEEGEGYSVNVPFEMGVDDRSFEGVFRAITQKAKTVFAPNAIVVQFGGEVLGVERDSDFNLTGQALGDCMRVIRDFNIPTLVLGGTGRSLHSVAKLWAYITAVAVGMESNVPEIVPEGISYREYFAPTYQTCTPVIDRENENTHKSLTALRRKVMSNLDKLKK